MKTDLYTKSILTIIAVSLLMLVLRDQPIIAKAFATEGKAANYGLVPVNEDGSINVRFSDHDQINVNIADITTSQELDVNIDEVGGSYVSSGGPIRVREVQ